MANLSEIKAADEVNFFTKVGLNELLAAQKEELVGHQLGAKASKVKGGRDAKAKDG